MNENQTSTQHRRAKRVGLAFGVPAVAAMAALGLNHGASTPTMLAGSGDAPTNTTYTQPAPSAMNVGSTATFSAPPSEPAIESAVPSVKAGG
ncbi:MAG: hypothetical protein QOJ28_3560 [Mycobacterium sp.]|jgi:hypothetical protein|nr:hypothetical protein [Mycobacterium sp.]MDT5250926.1 hypothetical protein [Mycobacterium sp.]